MSTLREARHVSVSIDRAPDEVYAFAANPENLPRWASGLGEAVREVGDEWIGGGGVRCWAPGRGWECLVRGPAGLVRRAEGWARLDSIDLPQGSDAAPGLRAVALNAPAPGTPTPSPAVQ